MIGKDRSDINCDINKEKYTAAERWKRSIKSEVYALYGCRKQPASWFRFWWATVQVRVLLSAAQNPWYLKGFLHLCCISCCIVLKSSYSPLRSSVQICLPRRDDTPALALHQIPIPHAAWCKHLVSLWRVGCWRNSGADHEIENVLVQRLLQGR